MKQIAVRPVQLHRLNAYPSGATGCVCESLTHARQVPVIERERSVVFPSATAGTELSRL
jgi:hypothetical protein